MRDQVLRVIVERAAVPDKYVWVISERRTNGETVEVASSLQYFDQPSDALLGGQAVLRGLGLLSSGTGEQAVMPLSLRRSTG